MNLRWTFIQPSLALQSVVRDYIFLRSSEPLDRPHGGVILPRANVSLLLNLGQPLHRSTTLPTVTNALCTAIAPQAKPYTLVYQGHVDVIGINFKVGHFLSCRERSLHGLPKPLPGKVHMAGIINLLKTISEPQERTAIIEQMLMKHIQKHPPIIQVALDQIASKVGTINIHQLCNDLGISPRQLERLFRQHVGLSPKRYARVVRFNHVLESMRCAKSLPHQDIATYYYDQSHFIREFRGFTSTTPTEYVNRPSVHFKSDAVFVDRDAYLEERRIFTIQSS